MLFTITGVVFGQSELNSLMKCLEKTNLQAMALSPTYLILNSLALNKEIHLQTMHFCPSQGIFFVILF